MGEVGPLKVGVSGDAFGDGRGGDPQELGEDPVGPGLPDGLAGWLGAAQRGQALPQGRPPGVR